MDEVAGGIIDKFSVLDFFNVVIVGAFFSFGMSFLFNKNLFDYLYNPIGISNIFAKGLIVAGCCYMCGAMIQNLSIILFSHEKAKLREECLSEVSNHKKPLKTILHFLNIDVVIRNKNKREIHQKLLQWLLESKRITSSKSSKESNKENNSYYFAYCEYYNSVRKNNTKTEKMRELSALCESITTCMLLLLIVSIAINYRNKYYNLSNETNSNIYVTIILLLLSIGSLYRALLSRFNWTRMVLATYEASVDQEKSTNNSGNNTYLIHWLSGDSDYDQLEGILVEANTKRAKGVRSYLTLNRENLKIINNIMDDLSSDGSDIEPGGPQVD